MAEKYMRLVLGLLTGFISLTAIGGGLALLTSLEKSRIPLEWLAGTPFDSYTIPALLLIFVVGGSAAAAGLTLIRGHHLQMELSMIAGLIMVSYIVTEVLILQQEPPGPTPTEYLYFTIGLLVFVVAGYSWLNKDQAALR